VRKLDDTGFHMLPRDGLRACRPTGDCCLVAGAFALPAGLGADTAMFVMTGMFVAFVGAQAAEVGAGLQHLDHQDRGGGGSSGQHRPGTGAGIRTIEIQPDATGKPRGIFLGEARVSAGDAGLCAIEAGFNALDQGVIDDSGGFGMTGQHLAHAHVVLSFGDTA
jgi:hypothetical protein